ncbi:MAG: hypothetical protein COB02_13955 [Candidatus Cloacimonadota bacterium]|nr:MAG: hypothetical protein COB02_13955 [Candidatus Cloacimonadota bacterium]
MCLATSNDSDKNSLSSNLSLISDIFLDHELIQSATVYSRLHNASIIFEVDSLLLLEISSCTSKYTSLSYELKLLEKKFHQNKRQVIFEVRLPFHLSYFINPKEYQPICHLFHNRIKEYYNLCLKS